MSLLAEDTPVRELSFCAIDLETTGLFYYSGDRLCELGAVRVSSGQFTDYIKTFVNPGRLLTRDSSAVSGITDDMIKNAPRFAEVAERFLNLIERSVLVFHNAGFDMGFLNSELGRIGLHLPNLPILDTRMIARHSFKFDNHRLGFLTKTFGITHSVRHRAITDAILTYRLLLALIGELGDDLTLGDLIKAQGKRIEIPPLPILPADLKEFVEKGTHLRVRYRSKKGKTSVKYLQVADWGEYKGHTYLIGNGGPRSEETALRLDRVIDIRPASTV